MTSRCTEDPKSRGVLPSNSPDLFTGETWRVHFTVPGAYVYACPYHHDRGMIGSIIVEE